MSDRYELSVWPNEDGTYSAMIECTAFVDHLDNTESVETALQWAQERTAAVSDPFTYEEE